VCVCVCVCVCICLRLCVFRCELTRTYETCVCVCACTCVSKEPGVCAGVFVRERVCVYVKITYDTYTQKNLE